MDLVDYYLRTVSQTIYFLDQCSSCISTGFKTSLSYVAD